MSADTILNLDELYGLSRPIKVRWQSKEYELYRPDALGPEQIMRNQMLHDRWRELDAKAKKEGVTPYMAEIQAVTQEMLSILGPELAKANLPFLAQVKVLEFYIAQVEPRDTKKARRQRTGRKSTRS